MDRIKSLLQRLEEWFIDNDLHIYFGALTIVVVSVLGWMLKVEMDKTTILRNHTVELVSQNSEKERIISNLQLEVSNLKNYPLPPASSGSKPVIETVDKVSSKLNAKIEKVQNSLISAPTTKVITKTQVQTVEKPIPVDSELKAMMRQSFCSSFPEDKTCRVKK